MKAFISNNLFVNNVLYNGKDNIEGVTLFNINDTKIIAPFSVVCLYDQRKNLFIKKAWSDKDGSYIIDNIDFKKGPFFVVSHDHTKQFNGVIADNIGGENVDD